METSYFGYLNQYRETEVFVIDDFYSLGEKLARTIFEYYVIQKQERRILKQRTKERYIKKQKPLPKSREDSNVEFNHFGEIDDDVSEFSSAAYNLESQATTVFSRVPIETIKPLNIAKEEYVERNLEEVIQVFIIQMIKQDCSDSEESESQGSGSESDDNKNNNPELPPLEKNKRAEENVCSCVVNQEKKQVKRKLILHEKFAKRLQQIRDKRKKDKKSERKHNFPSIISSVSTNRRLKSTSEKDIN